MGNFVQEWKSIKDRDISKSTEPTMTSDHGQKTKILFLHKHYYMY